MDKFLNELLDKTSQFINRWPGLLPLIGLVIIILNLLLHIVFRVIGFTPWLLTSNLLLHIGLIIGLLGFLLIRPLE